MRTMRLERWGEEMSFVGGYEHVEQMPNHLLPDFSGNTRQRARTPAAKSQGKELQGRFYWDKIITDSQKKSSIFQKSISLLQLKNDICSSQLLWVAAGRWRWRSKSTVAHQIVDGFFFSFLGGGGGGDRVGWWWCVIWGGYPDREPNNLSLCWHIPFKSCFF